MQQRTASSTWAPSSKGLIGAGICVDMLRGEKREGAETIADYDREGSAWVADMHVRLRALLR